MNGPYGLPGVRDNLPPFLPGGYATLISGTPLGAGTSGNVFYTPDAHNAFPVIQHGTRHAVYFDEPRLVLGAHAANAIHDVFGVERNGKGHIVSGPAWATPTAGSGARGQGGGTTELARIGGMLVNRWGIPGYNNEGSQFIPPNEGTYLFSIFIDGSANSITCHNTYGQSRKWGIWNAYNRRRLFQKAGDATASWSYGTNTIRGSNNDANNKITVFSGLADEYYNLRFDQDAQCQDAVSNAVTMQIGIGYNFTTVFSGRNSQTSISYASAANSNHAFDFQHSAAYLALPSLGINDVQAAECTPNAGSLNTFYGTEARMLLSAEWRG